MFNISDANYQWVQATRSQVVDLERCECWGVIFTSDGVGQVIIELYDGRNILGKRIIRLSTIVSTSFSALFLKPVLCENGLYLYNVQNLGSALIFLRSAKL